ncbi:MAG TPA: metallophosphoesterase family protein [Anaerolineales bacterium]|nr:metallophosphoesterase family protein [Anaerolineales bacterium]
MRILILSDIHANFTALETVLEHAGEVDSIWCLGDLVGYGPDPNECVEKIRAMPNLVCLIGNHDAAVIDQMDAATFNPEARLSIEWTLQRISADNLAYLSQLPNRIVVENTTLVHGSPRSPTFEYLLDTHLATINFSYFETPFCFVGHTHLPAQYILGNGQGHASLIIPQPNQVMRLAPRSILNPGSVGQPRDRDPRAAYAIYETQNNAWDYRRVQYDISAVQKRMKAFKLPERHIQRLAAGW